MSLDIKKLREVVDRATPGEWDTIHDNDVWYIPKTDQDSSYIATFNPKLVGELLDEIEKLKLANERLKTLYLKPNLEKKINIAIDALSVYANRGGVTAKEALKKLEGE